MFFRGDCCPWTRASSCGREACEEQRENSSSYRQNQQQTTNQGEAHFAIFDLNLFYEEYILSLYERVFMLHLQVVEEIVTEETPKKASESVVEDILANEISTPTGIR